MRLSTTPIAPALGRLVEHPTGVPMHGQFVLARTRPADGSSPVELSTMAGTRMWKSPNDDVARVMSEATAAAQLAGQAVAFFLADPGHWQQLFVVPLFRVDAEGALQAVMGVSELGDATRLERGRHLVGVADATTAIDLRSAPIADDLLPPRARPGG